MKLSLKNKREKESLPGVEKNGKRRLFIQRIPARGHLAAGGDLCRYLFLIVLQCRRLQLFAHLDDFFIVAVNILPDGVHIIKNIIKQVVNRLSFAHIMKCRPVYIFEEE